MWRSENGAHYRTLTGHAHWINTLALNVDYVLRIGAYDPETQTTCENAEVWMLCHFRGRMYERLVEDETLLPKI